jgi:hypothetical protein
MAAVSMQAAAVERTELTLLMLSLVLSATTVAVHCLRGGARVVVWGAFVCGAALVGAPLALDVPKLIEPVVRLTGAGMIVAAHVINLVNCRCRGEGASCAEAESLRRSPRC